MSIWDTVLIGIISGIIASFCYSIVMCIVRPRFTISADIAEWGGIYYIKVVNKTISTVTELDYCLNYCIHHTDGVSKTIEIPPIREKLVLISGNRPFNRKYSDNALQITYKIDMNKYRLNDEDRCLVFYLLGNHSFSNTKKCKTQTFYKKNVKRGIFETGNSVKVLVNHSGMVEFQEVL